MKSKAQIAYEAYYDCAGGKSLATGQQLPPWDRLGPGIQAAWFAAAAAVVQAIVDDSSKYAE